MFDEGFRTWVSSLAMLGLSMLWISIKKFILKPLLYFFFKSGVIAWKNIFWKKIIFIGIPTLFKKHIANMFIKLFQERVFKYLKHPLILYLSIQWKNFKSFSLWKKISSFFIGLIPAGILLWVTNGWTLIVPILAKFSIGQFLTGIITIFVIAIQKIEWVLIEAWKLFIFVVFVKVLEKTPYFGKKIRRLRVVISWKTRNFSQTKEKILYKKINRPVKDKMKKLTKKIAREASKQKDSYSESFFGHKIIYMF
ncbi:hypothetical protein MK079_01050 [Candidatus Gracilibacteria bacterium]|nr:hypothetical protein [Candidatus Gracilibacteria bacterium]